MLFPHHSGQMWPEWKFSGSVNEKRKNILGNSLVAQWLRLSAFRAEARVQSLVGDLRSHKLSGAAKKKKKERTHIISHQDKGFISSHQSHNTAKKGTHQIINSDHKSDSHHCFKHTKYTGTERKPAPSLGWVLHITRSSWSSLYFINNKLKIRKGVSL